MSEKTILKCSYCGKKLTENYNEKELPYWISKTIYPDKPPLCDDCVYVFLESTGLNYVEYSVEEMEDIPKYQMECTYLNEKDNKIKKISEVFSECKETIKNQDFQLDNIIRIINHNYNVKNKYTTLNIMMVGSTGVGKTLIAKTVAEVMDIPYVIESATQFTESGYYGRSVEEMVVDLYKAANYDVKKTERGIIFIDEIDKKESSKDGRDVSGEKVLDSLLTMIQGSKVFVKMNYETVEIDTTFITFIAMGVFPKLDEIRRKRLNNLGSIGFDNKTLCKIGSKEYIASDFEKIGFNSQFIARLGKVIELNNHTKESLTDIILNSKAAGIVPWKEEFNKNNIDLKINDEVVKLLVDETLALNVGARGISRRINEVLIYILTDIKDKEITCGNVILDVNTFNNPSEYKLV